MRRKKIGATAAALLLIGGLGAGLARAGGIDIEAFSPPVPGEISASSLGKDVSVSPAPGAAVNADAISVVENTIGRIGESGGLLDIVNHSDTGKLTVYWHGEVPAQLKTWLATEPYGVTVTVVDAAMDRVVYNRLPPIAFDMSRHMGIEISGISLDAQTSTVHIYMTDSSGQGAAFMDSMALRFAPFKVIEEPGLGPAVGLSGRLADTNPFKAGARLSINGYACSSGFAVLIGSAGRLLSSRHCDTTANLPIWNGDGSVQIAPGGSSVAGIGSIDSLLVDPVASPATTPSVYSGLWYQNTL